MSTIHRAIGTCFVTWLVSTAASAQAPVQPPAPVAPQSADAPQTILPAGRMEYWTLDSKTLKHEVDVGVYLPAGYDHGDQRYPVVYFLHGLWLDAHSWERRNTPATLDGLINQHKVGPMIVVCPDGMRSSMYVNALDGNGNWGDYLATELVQTIDAKYRTLADRATRGLSGESMGGFGALNLAFKHPDVFGSVSALSAAIYPVDPDQLPDRIKQFAQQWKPVFGWPIDVPHWKEWNPLALAESLPVESLKRLAIYFDCGDQDRYGFNQTNGALHAILEKRAIPHEWTLRSGGHGHLYFEENVQFSLLFHGKLFEAAAKAAAPKH